MPPATPTDPPSPRPAQAPTRGRRIALVLVVVVLTGSALAAVLVREWPVRREARASRRFLAAGRFAEARGPLERWLRARPGSAEAHFLEARVAIALGLRREAYEARRKARELGYPQAGLDLLQALIDVQFGQHARAKPILRREFDEGRGPDPQLDEALARAYLETYELKDAKLVLERWARDAPGDPRPFLWRTEVHRRTEDEPEELVIADYREALRRDPGLAAARLGLADELRKAYRNAEAAAEYARYLALRPDDPAGHLGAGHTALALGDGPAAARHLDRALELDPGNAEAHQERAKIDIRRGADADALDHLDRALQANPFDLDLHYSRKLVLTRLRRLDDAKREQAALDRLKADHDQLEALQSLLAKSPRDRHLQSLLARWMLEHGHDREGVSWARKILNDQPGHPETCALLAEYYELRGDAASAGFYRSQSAQ